MKPCSECGNIGAHYATCSIAINLSAIATGEAPAASPAKWDESQTEEYTPTLYDPIITAAHNDNAGKGVYFVARWKAVANGLLADGETRKDAVRALLDATSDWLGVFVATERRPAAASPEPVEWQWRDAATVNNPPSKWFNDPERYCKLRANDSRYEVRALYAEPTPNSAADELEALRDAIIWATGMEPDVYDNHTPAEVGMRITQRLEEAFASGELAGRHDSECPVGEICASQIRALRVALKPFGAMADFLGDKPPDVIGFYVDGRRLVVSTADICRARTALAKGE